VYKTSAYPINHKKKDRSCRTTKYNPKYNTSISNYSYAFDISDLNRFNYL